MGPVRLALAVVKGAAAGGLLTVVVVGGLHAAAPAAHQHAVQRADTGHHCSYAGFSGRVPPSSALVRAADGELRQVSFAVGWDVYSGRRAGTLVAVCLDQPGPDEMVQVAQR